MPENQRSNPSALTRSLIRLEIRVQRVESNVIIGVLFAKGKVGNIGAEGCKKAGQTRPPFLPKGDCHQFDLSV
jgi:hypothetical protein